MILKQDHTTWCSDFLGEVALLQVYVEGLKQHLVDEKERFHNEVQILVLPEQEEPCGVVRFFRGLDDESWSLEHIFSQHFPNLLLRSTLVAFYAFAEVALDTLCERFARHMKSRVTVSDMKDRGICRARLYLTKMCGIDFGRLASWPELRKIAEVRNLITHADGRITQATKPQVVSDVKSSPYLRIDGDDLILSLEYLDHFLRVIKDLIQTIGEQIQNQQSPGNAQ